MVRSTGCKCCIMLGSLMGVIRHDMLVTPHEAVWYKLTLTCPGRLSLHTRSPGARSAGSHHGLDHAPSHTFLGLAGGFDRICCCHALLTPCPHYSHDPLTPRQPALRLFGACSPPCRRSLSGVSLRCKPCVPRLWSQSRSLPGPVPLLAALPALETAPRGGQPQVRSPHRETGGASACPSRWHTYRMTRTRKIASRLEGKAGPLQLYSGARIPLTGNAL